MKKNENLYKFEIQEKTENTALIYSTYELSETPNLYFIELKLGSYKLKIRIFQFKIAGRQMKS